MAKSSGLGQNLYFAGVDLSNDVSAVSSVHGGNTPFVVTGLDKSAFERIGGLLDGGLHFEPYFNAAAAKAHPTLSPLPTTDIQIVYATGTSIGSPAAGIVAKQLNYDGTRGADGSLAFAVADPVNGYALEWGDLLTAGLRTDTGATSPATGLDGLATSTTGWCAYLQVTAFTGTSVTVTLQDSADNAAFAGFTGSAFTAVTVAPGWQRIEGAAGATVRRYVRAITTGTFNPATFAVMFCRHPTGATA